MVSVLFDGNIGYDNLTLKLVRQHVQWMFTCE